MSGDPGSRPEAPPPDPQALDWSSLTRGRFEYLPVVPGRLEFAIESPQTESAKVSKSECCGLFYLEKGRRIL